MDRDPRTRADFARRLRALRRAVASRAGHEINQQAMAESLGLEAERYRRYERGEAEPSLDVLIALRQVTGVSLDVLVAGLPPTSATIVTLDDPGTDEITTGYRLRAARRTFFSDTTEIANLTQVSPATWDRWEQGLERPDVGKMAEFAQRCGVSLDFLYRGQLTGMAPEVWAAMRALHPELQPEAPADPAPGSKATFGMGKVRRGGKPVRLAEVAVLRPEIKKFRL